METTEWTIPDLLQLSGGYWSACALHAAVRLDIFTVLDGAVRPAGEVANLCSTDSRSTAMLLDALSALGLLEKNQNGYAATQFSKKNLSQKSPSYIGYIIMHHYHLMDSWARLIEAVSTGSPIRNSDSHGDDESNRENFLMGMFNLASLLAPRISKSINLSGRHALLDLGGGPGTYAIHFCIENPDLTSVVYDLPTTRTYAEATVARFNLSHRITFASGDYHKDPLPSGFDAVWMSHILHIDGPAACASLLDKAVGSLDSGGVLMVQEFILNDAKDGPLFPALFSLNMLLGTETGQSYSETELSDMMTKAGLTDVKRLELDLPNGAGVMQGRKA